MYLKSDKIIAAIFLAAASLLFSSPAKAEEICSCDFTVHLSQSVYSPVSETMEATECDDSHKQELPFDRSIPLKNLHSILDQVERNTCDSAFVGEHVGISSDATPWIWDATLLTKDNCSTLTHRYDDPPILGGVDHVYTVSCALGEKIVQEVTITPLAGTGSTDIPFELPTKEIRGLNKIQGVLPGQGAQTVIGRIVLFNVLGLGWISLTMTVYAGFLWMTSRGNEEHQKKALQILLWTGMGVAVMITGAGVVQYLFDVF